LDLETVFKASRCVLAAEKLLVFRRLHKRELSAGDISRRTGIQKRHCEPFLDFLVFLGLLKKKGGLYRNSPLANKHFIHARSIDWTRLWSAECINDYEALTVLEDVITSDKNWQQVLGKERKPDYELARENRQWARGFAYALYDLYKPVADILAANLDLSEYRSLLDVGGGSGVISFALVRAYPHLKACILELPFVCDAAKEIIRKERLSRRVRAQAGDMNKSIPTGFDVIMFWNVGHIDDRVMKMAYDSLPDGGMIVRDCFPPSRSRTPSPSAFMHQYLSVRPKQQNKSSIINSLKEAGFGSVKYRRISPNIGLITGLKGQARQ
jgi:cyclopropane fatty-acyl-phospholipid synthase-like methyltransferase